MKDAMKHGHGMDESQVMSTTGIGNETNSRKVWEWLAEAEDNLEKTVEKYNELVRLKERLERREFVREILIRHLRQDVRKREAARETAETVTETTEIQLRWEKERSRQLKLALEDSRNQYDALLRMHSAQEILTRHAQAQTRLLTGRIRELSSAVDEGETKARMLTTKGVSVPKVEAAQETPTEQQTLSDLQEKQVQISRLVDELHDDRALIRDQQSALLEWQEAYSKLEAEVKRLNIELAASKAQQIQSPSPVRMVPSAIQKVQLEKTNGIVINEGVSLVQSSGPVDRHTSQNGLAESKGTPAPDVSAPMPGDIERQTSGRTMENQLTAAFKSAIKLISKM